MATQSVDWAALEVLAGPRATDVVRELLIDGSSPVIDPHIVAVQADVPLEEAITLLDALVSAGALSRTASFRCPAEDCGQTLDRAEVEVGECPHCGAVFQQLGTPPSSSVEYRIEGEVSRGVPWLLAVHGFNTVGPWQEEFSWRVANKYYRRAPVLNYKFGLVRLGVLARWRHRQLAAQLGQRIRSAQTFARSSGIDRPPDLILHSFGTLLFATLLELPAFDDLTFGRVILTGSIVRPDFDWGAYVRDGRIDVLLNHCGQRDIAVRVALAAIPESGPSGYRGFDDRSVLNVAADTYGHGTFFDSKALADNLGDEGLWDRFLRYPKRSLTSVGEGFWAPRPWATLPRILWTFIRWIVIILAVAAAAAAVLSLIRVATRYLLGV